MFIAFILIVLISLCGMLLTYLYDEDAPLPARFCSGVIIGQSLFGILGFWIASVVGLNLITIIVTTIILMSSLFILKEYKTGFQSDWKKTKKSLNRVLAKPTLSDVAYFSFYFFTAILLWFFYNRAMVVKNEGIFTGASNNLGDLPFHLGVINSFAFGQNFPPEHLAYSGTRFTYPFISDFIAAVFVGLGAEIQDAIWLQNMFLTMALVGVLHYYAWRLTKDRLASVITPVLLLFSGGLGWLMLFRQDMNTEQGLFSLLWDLKHDYTIIPETSYRWGNSLTTLFVTQRSILLGLPLSIIIFTILWKAFNDFGLRDADFGIEEKEKEKSKVKRQKSKGKSEEKENGQSAIRNQQSTNPQLLLISAGVLTGLLPLIHAHTFAAVICVAGVLALFCLKDWKAWAMFFVVAFALAAPQLFWVTRGASAEAKSFVEISLGWDKGETNFVIFWIKNTGVFIPLLLAALCWRGKDYLISKRWMLFYFPFIFLFIGPNVLKLAPWVWDNIKVLIHWYVASIPLVAILLARLWRVNIYGRVGMIVFLLSLTFAGVLDVWRIASSQIDMQEYDRDGVLFAEKVKQVTPPRALILTAPTYNSIAFLTGRRLFLGYVGHVWSHGIDYRPREKDINQIFSGNFDAREILKRNKIDYVIIGPQERGSVPNLNEAFFANMKVEAEVGVYRLYKVE